MKILAVIASPLGKGNTYKTVKAVENRLQAVDKTVEFEYLILKDMDFHAAPKPGPPLIIACICAIMQVIIERRRILKYRCLILDHDDTVVKSTPDIHYPSFAEALKVLRPDMKPLTLEEFVSYCFNPGFGELCRDILKFSDEEQDYQYRIWKSSAERIPDFYPGFPELITDYKKAGGIIAVVSHSEKEIIARDYMLKCGLEPDLIFGWEQEEHKRKPSPYPVLEIMKRLKLENDQLLMVDDLKPGLDMARSCSIAFAAAGWSHITPEIKEYMEANSDYYFSTVTAFREFIFK